MCIFQREMEAAATENSLAKRNYDQSDIRLQRQQNEVKKLNAEFTALEKQLEVRYSQ
jgi:hypothetical protein